MSHPFGYPLPVSKRTAMKTKARTKGLTPSTKNCLLCWCRLKICGSPTWKCWLCWYVEYLTKAIYALFSLAKTMRTSIPPQTSTHFLPAALLVEELQVLWQWEVDAPALEQRSFSMVSIDLCFLWTLPPTFPKYAAQGGNLPAKSARLRKRWDLKSRVYSESQDVLF